MFLVEGGDLVVARCGGRLVERRSRVARTRPVECTLAHGFKFFVLPSPIRDKSESAEHPDGRSFPLVVWYHIGVSFDRAR